MAFERAAAPYNLLARDRAQSKGMRGRTIGPMTVWYHQDNDLAAAELFADADRDHVCFDAALWFVAEQMRLGLVVPEALREWGYGAILGTIERPSGKGKWTCRGFVPVF